MTSTYEPDDQDFAPGVVEAVLARPIPVMVAAAVGLAVAVAITMFLLPERYTSASVATIADPQQSAFSTGGSITADFERHLSAAASFASSQRVLDAAADDLGVDAETLDGQVSVVADVDDRTLAFRATTDTPLAAARAADAMVAAFNVEHAAHLGEQAEQTLAVLDEQIDAARAELDDASDSGAAEATLVLSTLQERRVELAVNAASYGSGVEFIEPAEVPSAASSPDLKMNAAVGLLVGILAGMAFVWFRADRRRELASSDAPQALLDAPLLGKIPEFSPGSGALTRAAEMPADEYQFVASALHSRLDEDCRVILVAGAETGAGSSVTAANLAVAAARDDLTVAVVDACVGEELGALFEQAPNQAGLLDLLSSGDGSIDAQRLTWALGPVSVGGRSVRLLALGTSSRATLASQLRSRAAQQLFDMLRSRFDRIIVDCGSVLDVATAGSLARSADATVLVVRNGTESDTVLAARERLAVDGLSLVGYVYTRADSDERRRFRAPSARTHVAAPAAPSVAAPALPAPSTPTALPEATHVDEHLDGSALPRMNGSRMWPIPTDGQPTTSGPHRQGSAN